MLDLLRQKPYSEISVCEICKEAQISRQTFYSLFRSKENVISYVLQENYCFTLQNDCLGESFSLEALSGAYASYIESQKDFISLLVANDLVDCMRESIRDMLLSCDDIPSDDRDPDRCFAADFIASGLSSIAKNYVLYEDEMDKVYLQNTICRLFGGSLFKN